MADNRTRPTLVVRRSVSLLFLLGMVWLLLAACTPAEPAAPPTTAPAPDTTESTDAPATDDTQSWDQILEAAKAEGSVTLYGAMADAALEDIRTGFEAATGIRVEVQRLNAGPQRERVDQEIAANRLMGDVLLNNDTPWLRSVDEQGLLLDLESIPNKSDLPSEWWMEKMPIVSSFSQSLLYNTANVAAGEIQSWEDLLDPKFKGRIVLLSTSSGLGVLTWYTNMLESQGEDYLRALAEQEPVFVDTTALSSQMVAAGEKDIAPLNVAYTTVPLKAEGAPVEDLYLAPVSVVGYHVVALDGPHPNAALVLVNWLLTPEGQEAMCGEQKLTCHVPGIETSLPLPEEYQRYDPGDISARSETLIPLIDEIFGQE